LAGDPFYVSPHQALKWTLPQVVFMWIRTLEAQAADARDQLVTTVLAIGIVFGKNGERLMKKALADLSGPRKGVKDVYEELDPTSRLVLFGSQAGGTQRDSD
jgi:hypothetical protein